MKGSIKTDRRIEYRGLTIHEESFSVADDPQVDTCWGVQYVIDGLPHRRRFFQTPGMAVEYIDFQLDVAEKLAHPLLVTGGISIDPEQKSESDNG